MDTNGAGPMVPEEEEDRTLAGNAMLEVKLIGHLGRSATRRPEVTKTATKSLSALLQKHSLGGYTPCQYMPLSNCHRSGHIVLSRDNLLSKTQLADIYLFYDLSLVKCL